MIHSEQKARKPRMSQPRTHSSHMFDALINANSILLKVKYLVAVSEHRACCHALVSPVFNSDPCAKTPTSLPKPCLESSILSSTPRPETYQKRLLITYGISPIAWLSIKLFERTWARHCPDQRELPALLAPPRPAREVA